jgi:hypothetical protein
MNWSSHKGNECYLVSAKTCPFVEFIATDGTRHGFHSGQLLSYRLESSSVTSTADPPDELTLAFSVGDVVITGWRLATITDRLRDGDLLSVRVAVNALHEGSYLPGRHAIAAPTTCIVACIRIKPIDGDRKLRSQGP